MKNGLERWDERYAAQGYLFGKTPNKFLARQANRLTAGMTALALADGEGRNGVWLAQQGLDVLSTDGSEHALAKARELAKEHSQSLRFERVDVFAWDWPENAFDCVVAIFIQFAPPGRREELFERMKKALRPGGLLLLHGYRPEQVDYGTGGPPYRENMYTEPMLREAFAELEIIELISYDEVIKEGTGHDGISALIDLVARKPEGDEA